MGRWETERDSSEIGARGLGGHSYVTSKINSPFPLSFIKPLSNFWVLFLLQFETLYEHSTTERDDEEKEEVGIRYFPISLPLPPSLSLAPFCISRPHRQTYGVGPRQNRYAAARLVG